MTNRKSKSLKTENTPKNESKDGQSPNFEKDQEILANEKLSDVNQLNAFGGDRPQQDLVVDESGGSVDDQKYNR